MPRGVYERKEGTKNRIRKAKMGDKNPRWDGGNSDYPDHAELKRVRIEVLKRAEGKCEICGKPAKVVHHKDENKSNHSLDNLIALCFNCHESLHCDDNGKSIRGKPTKYGMKYGMTLKEIAKVFGVCTSTVCYWINKYPEKKLWMEGKLEEIKKEKNI